MGMSRPSYGRGQGSFFGRRPPPMRNPRMPMPPMNQSQAPSGGGFMSQLASSPMMRRPMPGGPGKGRSIGRPMPGGPGKGRGQMQQPMSSMMGGFFNPAFKKMTQGPINTPQMPMPRPAPFMGRVGNNMPQPPMDFPQPTARPVDQTMGRPMPQPNFILGPMNRGGFYSGGITDLY